MNRRPRKSALASSPRWLAYAAASSATIFAASPAAEGEIHYSGHVHHRLRGHRFSTNAFFPLTQGASLLVARGEGDSNAIFDYLRVQDAETGGIRTGRFFFADKLSPRQAISNGPFYPTQAALISNGGYGAFSQIGIGFAGFKFDVGNGTQYGWVRIRTVVPSLQDEIVIEDYAWADPGESIKAGQTSADSAHKTPLPSSGSLGALALGAAGVLAWRKARAANQP